MLFLIEIVDFKLSKYLLKPKYNPNTITIVHKEIKKKKNMILQVESMLLLNSYPQDKIHKRCHFQIIFVYQKS